MCLRGVLVARVLLLIHRDDVGDDVRRLNGARRLTTVTSGKSVVNDGCAVVIVMLP